MVDKQTCEGLDCAWCVTFNCPKEYERLKARVKELEEKLNAQFTEMEEKLTAEEIKNFELKEEIKELKELNIRLNNQREIYYKEYLKIDKKLEIAKRYLIEIVKGEKLFTDKDYLFRAKLALQKMEEIDATTRQ